MLQNYTQQLFTTERVATNYGTTLANIQKTKSRHADEIIENIHFIYELSDTNGGKQEVLKWTLRGIIKLGMFIRSPQAKNFRLWAEMELEKSINKELENARIARENNLRLVDKVSDLQATLINKANRHQRQINGYKSQLKQHNQKIVILKHELAKYEKACECEVIDENNPKFKPFSHEHPSYKELFKEYIAVCGNNNVLKLALRAQKQKEDKNETIVKSLLSIQKHLEPVYTAIGAVEAYVINDDRYFLEHNEILRKDKI